MFRKSIFFCAQTQSAIQINQTLGRDFQDWMYERKFTLFETLFILTVGYR